MLSGFSTKPRAAMGAWIWIRALAFTLIYTVSLFSPVLGSCTPITLTRLLISRSLHTLCILSLIATSPPFYRSRSSFHTHVVLYNLDPRRMFLLLIRLRLLSLGGNSGISFC
ncbi:hypothetical protein BS17DRAFT_40640 [Gyrodon lividus]|nr:hypothetical protein BS17DRAFT_40640 [Gyrodon lividus]